MKINKIDLITISLPLKKYLRTSFGEINSRNTLIIKFYLDDGLVGYGESSLLELPLSEEETISSGIELIENKISPLIIGRSFEDILSFKNCLEEYKDNPVTIIGLEGAFYHLFSQKENVYIGDLFGVQKHLKQEAFETISISDDKKHIIDEVQKFSDQGYKKLKLKIMPGNDLEAIKLIKSNFKDIKLAVDGNAAYTVAHMAILQEIGNLDLIMIEQPFSAESFREHAELQNKSKVPICLDESIKSLADVERAFSFKSCKIVNIKPARIGSYYESVRIHDFCLGHGFSVFGGGRLESGIGKAFNLALSGLIGYNLPLDMSSSLEYFTDDVVDPVYSTFGGSINIPSNEKGLGFEVDEAKIKKYTINKKSIGG